MDPRPAPRTSLLRMVQEIVDSGGPGAPIDAVGDPLARICALLIDELPGVDWAGFYLVDPDQPRRLRLGPYAGEPRDHPSVAFGEALVGRAAEQRDAFVATDLQELAGDEVGHEDMRSELAVPVLDDEELVGSLDVASHLPAAFDEDALTFLRRVGELTGPLASQRRREA